MTAPPTLLGIVGPTGSGKTDLALALARRLPVEILVADSRQVYRGMDVGTAKPDRAARAAVPHHLLDLADPDESFTVADWVTHARRAIGEIAGRGRQPLLVAGTGLYVAALLDGHDYATQAWTPERRAELAAELEADGVDALAARLHSIAPEVAARIDLRNPRRVVRALERVEAGDAALARAAPYAGAVALVGILRPREVLYRRIDERASRLFHDEGLLDEAARLRAAGFGPELPPMTGHGYAEAMRHLAGEWTLEAAVARTAQRTRQYAKRQLTWFRRDRRIRWVESGELPGDADPVVDAAERALRSSLARGDPKRPGPAELRR